MKKIITSKEIREVAALYRQLHPELFTPEAVERGDKWLKSLNEHIGDYHER